MDNPPKKKQKESTTKTALWSVGDICFCLCGAQSRCLSLLSTLGMIKNTVMQQKVNRKSCIICLQWGGSAVCNNRRLESWAATEPDIDPISRQLATTYYPQTRPSSSPSAHEQDFTLVPDSALRWERSCGSCGSYECMDEGNEHGVAQEGKVRAGHDWLSDETFITVDDISWFL